MYGEETSLAEAGSNDEEEINDIKQTLTDLKGDSHNPFKEPQKIFGVEKEQKESQNYDMIYFDANVNDDANFADGAEDLLVEDQIFGLNDGTKDLDDPEFLMKQKAEYEKYAKARDMDT